MKDNVYYFELSQELEDPEIDLSNPDGVPVITKDVLRDLPNELMNRNDELIRLITTYESSSNLGFIADDENKILDRIIEIIETTNNINYSPFCVYFQVLKTSYSAYMSKQKVFSQDEKRDFMKTILSLYIPHRHDMYLSHGYSNVVLQVMSDNASSRRNGKTGIVLLCDIIEPKGFKRAKDKVSFLNEKYCYLLPDKGDKKLFNDLLEYYKIKFIFKHTRDNKYPDMFLKMNNDLFIIEHKLTNGGGGAQNAEINEIIQFIGEKEEMSNIHYVSCLQGNFIKNLSAAATQLKNVNQYNNIMGMLNTYTSNYFVNGRAIEQLIDDFLVEQNSYH